jgi:hypothetical protein
MPEASTYYAVTFRDPVDNKPVTIKARKVSDSELGFGFVTLSDFFFEVTWQVVVKPAEEQMAKRYENVKRLHLNLYAILAIEERGDDGQGLGLGTDRSKLVVLRPPIDVDKP